MLKALIFDDEYIVLQGLQMMIDWNQYGIELVGTATNGKEALMLFEECRPDIIFTDIRMPGMDGLQVIERILEMAPETICIVFSGFNEYDYVKKALKLGVADYLEKPITIKMIEEAIKKITEKISHQKSISSLQSRWEDTRGELLEKVTLDLLLLGEEAIPKWKEIYGDDAGPIVGVTVLTVSSKNFALDNHSTYKSVQVSNGTEHLHVVFHLQPEMEDLWTQLLTCPEPLGMTVGSGKMYSHLKEAKKSYNEALQAFRYAQFMEEKGWIRFEDIGDNPKIPVHLSEQEAKIIFCMRTGDKKGLLDQVNGFIGHLEGQRLNPDVMEREILKIIYLGMEVTKEGGGDVTQLYDTGFLPHVEIRSLNTREKMNSWFCTQMEKMIDWLITVRKETKHKAVEKACDYIKNNYFRDLSLQEVSEYVEMNPTYFSLLFKEEMNQSYIKYLTQMRMEKAKELLRSGQKVGEVSELVGYHSYKHFSELFKKHVGVKPGQFRDSF
ncbi:response regulator transcription factor [Neobacillus sp. Marseille-QA0830]